MLVDAMGRFRDLNPRQVRSKELHRVFAKSAKLSTERKKCVC